MLSIDLQLREEMQEMFPKLVNTPLVTFFARSLRLVISLPTVVVTDGCVLANLSTVYECVTERCRLLWSECHRVAIWKR